MMGESLYLKITGKETDKNMIRRLQAENASLKTEHDKYKSIVEGLPSIEDIKNTLIKEVENDRAETPGDLAKAIHKLIHKGE